MYDKFNLKRIFRYLMLSSGIWPLARLASFQPRSWGGMTEIRITENCNSKCLTCNAWKHNSTGELTPAEFGNIFDQLRTLGVSRVAISGGEALLRPDAIDIIKKAKSADFKDIMIKTNGLLLEKRSKELIDCGITHLCVSVDGMQEVDNFVRGIPFHFEKAIAGIRAINKLKEEKNPNLDIVIMTTLLGLNDRDIPRLIDLCNELNVSWNMNLLNSNMDLFRDIDVKKIRFSSQEMMGSFFECLKEKQQKYPSVVNFCSYELDYAKDFLRGKQKDPPCLNGYQGVSIGAHGEVFSNCFALPPVGNLRKNSLSEIIASDRYRNRLTQMYRRHCPGCTCYWIENVVAKHGIRHVLFCQRRLAKSLGTEYTL
jgi:MoaA/NifB/PqqE/SkfB family radical SAM enzyme